MVAAHNTVQSVESQPTMPASCQFIAWHNASALKMVATLFL
jgi:hypothetical protein